MHATSLCRNCNAATMGHYHYCANCGQETRLHVPSALEFIHEFIGHYVALEGKLWQTLKLLILKPGALTAEYLAGRRQRFVLPLRVFLTFSILLFAVLKYTGVLEPAPLPPQAAGQKSTVIVSSLVTNSPAMQKKLDHFNTLSNEQKVQAAVAGFYAYAPYAMFLLMPVFALYLKLLYLGTGRRYGEHLLFALHTNAFAYFTLALAALMPWTLARVALGLWLALYLPWAMQRVYGGRKLLTALRWTVLGLAHVISIAVAIVSALSFAVLH